MRKGRDRGGKNGGGGRGKKKKKRLMIIVATTPLPAVDRPNADCGTPHACANYPDLSLFDMFVIIIIMEEVICRRESL